MDGAPRIETVNTRRMQEEWNMAKNTVRDIWKLKESGQKIAMVTAYDYPTARLAEEAGIPMILVGDSVGMVVLGYESTVSVTMEDMLHHVKAVVRATQNSLVVGDMPFGSFQLGPGRALENAIRLVQEGGAQAVKLEGGTDVADTVQRIVDSGIPVMGHIGLTPQSVHAFGGYRVRGRTREEAERLVADALALEEAGAFAIVMELVPAPLAGVITERLTVPTIGIGAGPHCDGQVQVLHDIMGIYEDFTPRHAKRYLELGNLIKEALKRYVSEVEEGTFPAREHSSTMDESLLEGLS